MAGQIVTLPDDHRFKRFPYAGRNRFLVDQQPEEQSGSNSITLENYPHTREECGGKIGDFEGIVGTSSGLQEVLNLVRAVAPTDSTVLIEGETGTGKELVATAIHAHSRRGARPFITLNCAAIPVGLLESELFGHERGAFTGATTRKIGRFEAAHGGTLFLDEIGDMPFELQAKLLRVLQAGEFERLGSTQTIRVNVRLVAATNADMWKLVSERRFRRDLYYRLNVFPIELPPLRERAEDIPLLVKHFVATYAARMQRHIESIPPTVMNVLKSHSWPGNIRELQNVIERALILSRGPVLHLPLCDLKALMVEGSYTKPGGTLEEVERRYILAVLEQTNWVCSGANGAAALLGIKRPTLHYRMKKLGICRPQPSVPARPPM